MSQIRSSFYRPELDVVRFLAFILVFAHHTLQPQPGRNEHWESLLTFTCGYGLSLFFTLSAYLITLLLLREKDQTGSIHLSNFYKRRMLRIWPLYLLALVLGFAEVIHAHQLSARWSWFVLALVMLGNLPTFNGLIIGHLWSISIEEQFYVFWPTLMRHFSRRCLVITSFVLILIANAWLVYYGIRRADTALQVWCNSFVQFEMFAAGILLAIFETRRPRLSALQSLVMVAAAAGLWYFSEAVLLTRVVPFVPRGPLSLCLGYAFIAIGCVLLIVAASGLPKPRPLIYLGKISYGLYVFHIPVMFFVYHHTSERDLPRTLAALAITIGVAATSYRFFESPFLRLKRKLEIIKTRPV